MSEKKLKSIAFDLDTKALEKHYTKGDWHNAYNDIALFLKEYQFNHTQGSVYDSATKFSDEGLGRLIEKMSDTLTWLPQCVKSIRGYDQPIMIDYTSQIKDKIQINNKTLEKSPSKENHKKEKDSLKRFSKEQIERIRQKAKQKSKEQKPEINKDKGFEREF